VKLEDLVKLIQRANRAGRPETWPGEPDSTDADEERLMDQLTRLLPSHADAIRELASSVRIQIWCESFSCDYFQLATVQKKALRLPSGPCPQCGVPLGVARVYPFVYLHPHLFDAWTLEAPSKEAALEKFASEWEKRASHLTASSFEGGEVMLEDDYEAGP